MRLAYAGLCGLLATFAAQASEFWVFEDRVAVSAAPAASVYHHLDGAGRKHLAVSGQSVAVAWEDNRSGAPQVYATLKAPGRQGFPESLQVSGGSEAYEPAIASLADDRFVLAFEQDASVYASILTAQGPGAPLLLSRGEAGHASIASYGDSILASWRERNDGQWFVRVAELRAAEGNRLALVSSRTVEDDGLETPVLFPSVTVNAAGIGVAWEDRRAGHTRLLVSHALNLETGFDAPQALNEFFSERNQYDQGSGVTRVSLASFGRDEIVAAWMDKRRGGSGYGIYAALGTAGGAMFGPNEKVHGEPGDEQPHYNPATAGNAAGDFVVAWDDFRRGDSDVWISVYDSNLEWSRDYSPPVASGSGEQSHPAIALDEQQGLHLLWIERSNPNAPTRLWYPHTPPPPQTDLLLKGTDALTPLTGTPLPYGDRHSGLK